MYDYVVEKRRRELSKSNPRGPPSEETKAKMNKLKGPMLENQKSQKHCPKTHAEGTNVGRTQSQNEQHSKGQA